MPLLRTSDAPFQLVENVPGKLLELGTFFDRGKTRSQDLLYSRELVVEILAEQPCRYHIGGNLPFSKKPITASFRNLPSYAFAQCRLLVLSSIWELVLQKIQQPHCVIAICSLLKSFSLLFANLHLSFSFSGAMRRYYAPPSSAMFF